MQQNRDYSCLKKILDNRFKLSGEYIPYNKAKTSEEPRKTFQSRLEGRGGNPGN